MSALLEPWQSFYVMLGSSAAALTGLMFVVVSLASRNESGRIGISAYATPTMLHFCSVLLAAVVLVAPWPSLTSPAVVLALGACYGFIHVCVAWRRAKRAVAYKPDLEDVISYTALPLAAYAASCLSAICMPFWPARALFAIAVAVVLLLFLGIRNAWDIVTFIVSTQPAPDNDERERK